MAKKKGIKLLTELLNLEGIKVISHRQHERIGIILQLEPIRKESVCPRCRTKSHRVHQNHRYIVKDLPWGEKPVFLEINRRQFKCEKCQKPFSEDLDVIRKRRTYTKRLASKIIQEVIENAIHSVAKKRVVTTEEKAKHEQVLEGLKKSKYVLLKNEKDLREEQENKLTQVKEVSPKLKIRHELKEEIRNFFEQSDNWLTGLLKLGIWLASAKKYFPDSQKTIIRWLDEIIGYFDNRTTSGVVEGINNKLKLIKRSAYGFRNFENYRIRCLLNWQLIVNLAY
jgi:transposase